MITKHDQLRMAIHAELAPYDAFSGAAYGKKEMPFAITAGIAAGSAMAAGAAITAAGVAAVVAGTAVAAGLTMTIVGMATGDKELMKIGGYVGLAGGIAGAGLNMAGFGAEAFSAMESAAMSGAIAPTSVSAAETGVAGLGSANLVEPSSNFVGQVTGGSIAPVTSQGATGITNVANAANVANAGTNVAEMATVGQPIKNISGVQFGNIAPETSQLGTTAIKAAPTAAQAIGGTVATGATASKGAGTLFDGLSEFMKTPTGLAAVAELGKGVVGTITGSATNDIYRNKIAFDQQQAAYQMANANAIAPYSMTTTPLTDAQRQQANIDKYNQAKKAAGILTNTQQATA